MCSEIYDIYHTYYLAKWALLDASPNSQIGFQFVGEVWQRFNGVLIFRRIMVNKI